MKLCRLYTRAHDTIFDGIQVQQRNRILERLKMSTIYRIIYMILCKQSINFVYKSSSLCCRLLLRVVRMLRFLIFLCIDL